MKPRLYHFDEHRITLPKGTRVVLKIDLRATDGYLCKAGTIGVVEEAVYDSYTVRTPANRMVACQRDQLAMQRQDQLTALARRQQSWESLKDRVIYSAVVGSTAWGLADDSSDEDIKGVFVLPFEGTVGLWEAIDEIREPTSDIQYWEVQKLVYQGLRADANTLEMLWSPHIKVMTVLGQELLRRRRMFISCHIFGTFGRYAMSQFRKMRAAQKRRRVQQCIVELLAERPDLTHEQLVSRLCAGGKGALMQGKEAEKRATEAIHDLYNSLFDRGLVRQRGYQPLVQFLKRADADRLLPDEPRWKNAYNLLRLLYSGIRWLTEGEPLIEVPSPEREELLEVKRGEVSLDEVLKRADGLAARLEHAYTITTLPKEPDYQAAHDFVMQCRRHAAAEYLASRSWHGELSETALPLSPSLASPELRRQPPEAAHRRFEIPEGMLHQFLTHYEHLPFVVCSLVGSHSYGFPSQDSDFDLKAIHLAPAVQLLGLDEPRPTEQFLGAFGDREIDFTSHEAKGALRRLLQGDGNVLERIFSPYLLLPHAPDRQLLELRELAQANLSKRFHRHYSGFLRGLVGQYHQEPAKKIKTLLYMFRVALTGVHLLLEQQVLTDLVLLLERYPFDHIADLIVRKESAEQATVEDDRPYLAFLPHLERLLKQAHEQSPLPDEPQERAALDAWLKRWRQEG